MQDFRQREIDFIRRKDAQDMRRLFYVRQSEAKAPSLIHLQNRYVNSNEGTYASVKSLLSWDYMRHVDLSETRKRSKG